MFLQEHLEPTGVPLKVDGQLTLIKVVAQIFHGRFFKPRVLAPQKRRFPLGGG